MSITEDANSDKVFALAATRPITLTNLGGRIEVSVGGYTYTVEIPDTHRAFITGRYGWGGTELMHINATLGQDRILRSRYASMRATR
ncbi:hypothetical protein ABZ470_39745 [Streptosporangium sp. NPDC020072]|uniref:hypothetical protein n=1 Tax=Streptosporangium sp. NPDC020072 TaxID=3154788 RepID=UPI00343F320B